MTDEKKESRKWVYASLNDQEHEALLHIATENGWHASAAVAEAVRTLIEYHAKNAKNPHSVIVVQAATQENKAKENQLLQLKNLGAAYMANPTEEGADKLQLLCDMVGVSMEKLLGGISDSPHLREVLKDGQTVSKAEAWLLENMEMDKEYAQQDIQKKAAEAGIKYHMLKEAKLKINARRQDFQIESVRKEKNWAWQIRKRNPLQN